MGLFSDLKTELKDFKLGYKQKPESSLGFKYSALRDHPLHTGYSWLDGKKLDDGAEGLWRIHDSLYDLNDFINKHPGGKDWIKLTKGTDITEVFESHHIRTNAEALLPKYFKRKAEGPRNSPFTFKEKGFYRTLKRKVRDKFDDLPRKPTIISKLYADAMFLSYVGLFVLSVIWKSYSLAAMSGVCLGITAIIAHNFFHQKDNFRMYYFDFTFMPSKEWRISHALSHHPYTNTINDLEITAFEPFLQYLPFDKFFIFKYGPLIYSPIVYAFLYFAHIIRTMHTIKEEEKFPWPIFLPISIPTLTVIITGGSILHCFWMFLVTIIISSIYFSVIGVNAAHHHPDIFHDGDMPRYLQEMDWGVYQIDAVKDRSDINGSHFLVISNFGDHALHHLFPTLDHGQLKYLYPAFLETCDEFGIEYTLSTQLKLIVGQFKQLAKTEGKQVRPKPLKTTIFINPYRPPGAD